MKARFVSEAIDFERGKDPLSAMGLGQKKKLIDAFNEFADLAVNNKLVGIEGISLGPRGFTLSSQYRTSRAKAMHNYVKDLGIRDFFHRKLDITDHADGRIYTFQWKPQFKNLILKSDSRSIQYNIYRGWERHGSTNESIEFERGKEPKEAMNIGRESKIKREFLTFDEAADWAIRNLELITDDKYSPNDVIRKEGARVMPEDLTNYLMAWSERVKLTGYRWDSDEKVMKDPLLLQEIGKQMKKHGILIETMKAKKVYQLLEFERPGGSSSPLRNLGVGKEGLHRIKMEELRDSLGKDIREQVMWAVLNENIEFLVYLFEWMNVDPGPVNWEEIDQLRKTGRSNRFSLNQPMSDDMKELLHFYRRRENLTPERFAYFLEKYKDKGVKESVDFERGQDPYSALNIGTKARIDNVLKDEEKVYDMIIDMDQQLGTAMEIYLPYDEQENMVRMWLANEYGGKDKWEFDVINTMSDDSEEGELHMDHDQKLSKLKNEGWEELWTEDNYDVIESILYREKLV